MHYVLDDAENCPALTCSSGYVIPMSVMADMLSANNLNNRNVYNA